MHAHPEGITHEAPSTWAAFDNKRILHTDSTSRHGKHTLKSFTIAQRWKQSKEFETRQ